MEFYKLDLEVANWTEEIAIAEVGEEGFFDIEGIRIFWRKWGTNPNDWSIIGISQIGEVSENTLNRVEKKLKDFGFLDDPSIVRQLNKIRSNISQTPQSPKQKTVEKLDKLKDFERIENIKNVENISKPKYPNNLAVPIPFKEALPPTPNNNKGFAAFKQQIKKIFKFFKKPQSTPTNDYADWIININLNIFKKWLKTGKLINNINATNNLVATTNKVKKLNALQKFKKVSKKLNNYYEPTTIIKTAKKQSKLMKWLKTGKWK